MRAWWLAVVLLLAGCVGPGTVPSKAPEAVAPGPTVSASVHDLGQFASEPSVGVTSKGSLFVVAEDDVLRSHDGGRNWTLVHSYAKARNPDVPFTLDPWLWVDPVTDRIYVDHLTLACTTVSWSDDDGQTWSPDLPTACGSPVTDFQKLVTGKPGPEANTLAGMRWPTVAYLCYNKPVYDLTGNLPVGRYAAACAASYDGGTTWMNEQTLSQSVWVGGQQVVGGCDGGIWPPAVAPDGTVVVRSQPDCLFRTRDSGATWQAVGRGPEFQGTTMAFDDNGTLYALSADWDPPLRLSVSHDQGTTWSTPVVVQPPQAHAPQFAAIAAGAKGRVAVAFWATDENVTSYDKASDSARYDAWMLAVDGADTATPHVQAVDADAAAHDGPMHIGKAGRGAGPIFLGDFAVLAAGPDGTPWTAFPRTCNAGCRDKPNATADDLTPGGAVVALEGWHLRDGPRPGPTAADATAR